MNESLIICSSKKILKFYPKTGKQETIQEGKGVYFGICRNSRGEILCLARNTDGASSSIEVFNESLDFVGSFDIDVKDGHQIAIFGNSIVVTNTGHDCINMYNDIFQLLGKFYPFGKPVDGSMSHHINSINFFDERLFFVSHRDHEMREVGSIFALECSTMNEVARFNIGRHAHDIFLDGDSILCTASRDGELIRLARNDLDLIQRKKICDAPLLRGIARLRDNIYVAQSKEGGRQDRHSSQNAFLHCLDNDLKHRGVMDVFRCGQINDMISHG